MGSSEHSTRYPSPSDLANSRSSFSIMEDIYHHPDIGIFSSSSYDDDFDGTVTNLAPSVTVDSVPTKRVNTIPSSITDTCSYHKGIITQDYLHCHFACFRITTEPAVRCSSSNDPLGLKHRENLLLGLNGFIKHQGPGIPGISYLFRSMWMTLYLDLPTGPDNWCISVVLHEESGIILNIHSHMVGDLFYGEGSFLLVALNVPTGRTVAAKLLDLSS
ncbi:hypothetical protein Tco_0648732 [Tanacetum coccineum]